MPPEGYLNGSEGDPPKGGALHFTLKAVGKNT